MRIRVEVVGSVENQDSSQLTEAFARWLVQDRTVGPHVEISRIRSEADDGAMSAGLVEWLGLVLNSGFSVASLVYSHKTFRASLPPRVQPTVRLVVEHGDSRMVIEAGSAEEAAQITRLLTGTGLPGQAPGPASGTLPSSGADGDS
ncbi:effector-associated constant component EACC1 [Streptomyces rubrogriseus]|uniref:effector-associated constant component EACC1 n=1 Tax=Streptomyces rubrogriseus TaxID=194673 RepID=UPI0037A46062